MGGGGGGSGGGVGGGGLSGEGRDSHKDYHSRKVWGKQTSFLVCPSSDM